MAIFANEWPKGFSPGSDFVQIEDAEFDLASEPQGLIAVTADNDHGYLTVQAAKRLHHCLGEAIKNSEAPLPEIGVVDDSDQIDPVGGFAARDDSDIPF